MAKDGAVDPHYFKRHVGDDHIHMFNMINWGTKFERDDVVMREDALFHIIGAIEKPHRIRNRKQFIAYLTKQKEFTAIKVLFRANLFLA